MNIIVHVAHSSTPVIPIYGEWRGNGPDSAREHVQRRVDQGKGRDMSSSMFFQPNTVGSPLWQARDEENTWKFDGMSFIKVPLTGVTTEQANHAPNPPDAARYEGSSAVAAPSPRAFNPPPRWMKDLGTIEIMVSHLHHRCISHS